MIDGLKPYPEMKDSGVEWLGEVPEHWDVRRAKTLLRPVDVRSESGREELLTVSSAHGVVPRRLTNVTMFKAESYAGHKLCWPGDLVINSLWAWSRGLGVSRYHGIVSTAYGVYRMRATRVLDPRFAHELVRSSPFHWELRVRSKGVWTSRLQLTDDAFLGAPLTLPPPPDQAAIVRFLDYAERRLRRYIRAKQKLIQLLEEQKQAIIDRAVIQGLDPDVRLKDSGIEWLGEVPEHWEVVRLKTLVSHVTSGSRGWSQYAADEGALFVRIGNLTRTSIDLDVSDVVRLQLPDSESGEAMRSRIRRDDLLLSITAFIGSVAVAPDDIGEAYVSQHVALCRPRPGAANPRWVAYVLFSQIGQTHGQLSMYGGTKQGLSLNDVKSHLVVLPPRDEQDRLVDWIESTSAVVDGGIRSTRHDIHLLHELRTRLIADVVTGKLDVRDVAACLPEDEDSGDEDDALEEDELFLQDSDLDAELEEIEA